MLLICACIAGLAFQYIPRTRPIGPSGRSSSAGAYDADLIATFHGTVRTNQGRTLRVEDENKKLLEFHLTHKTAFFDGDKKIKVSDLKPGVRVAVDAKQFPDGELDPINVHVVHESKKPPPPADDDVLKP